MGRGQSALACLAGRPARLHSPGGSEKQGGVMNSSLWRGRKVLITGHTGFKGSWLALWLKQLGAEVTGIALDPVAPRNHWELLELGMMDHRQDIRDADGTRAILAGARPEIVFHLAAQPLVRRSYQH